VTKSTLATALPLLLTAFVVVRFALRELRLRTVKSPGIWIRPGILVLLSAYLLVLTFGLDGRDDAVTVASSLIGALLGVATAVGVLRNTTFAPAPEPRAVRVQGSRATVAFWIGALAVRLLARYLYPGGADPRAQLPLNCGTVILVTVAFAVIATSFQHEITKRSALLGATD
jgi:hypothetical protein